MDLTITLIGYHKSLEKSHKYAQASRRRYWYSRNVRLRYGLESNENEWYGPGDGK